MSNLSSVPSMTIDASVLAVPQLDCDTEDAFRYVETLLTWVSILKNDWFAINMSGRASESLCESGNFPLKEQLTELFRRCNIFEYDVNTVVRVANQLLTITPTFEDVFQVNDVLIEKFESEPSLIGTVAEGPLLTDLARCAILIAVLRKYCSRFICNHVLFVRKCALPLLRVKSHILYLEHKRDDLQGLPSPREYFHGDVLVCHDFLGFANCINQFDILESATDDDGIKLAIRIALFKFAHSLGEDPDWDNIEVPKIGSRFRETCQECCADQGSGLLTKILRAIVETVRQENLTAVHALRKSSGANASQRVRASDSAKASRRDIDYEFHLHFWECADGTRELANVVYHNDFSIAE